MEEWRQRTEKKMDKGRTREVDNKMIRKKDIEGK